MSRKYQPKNKELAKVKVISSSDFNNNRKIYRFVGSVSKNCSNFITTQRNKKTGKCSYIEDTHVLTKRSKNQLVRFFMDKENANRKVAYLVVEKNK